MKIRNLLSMMLVAICGGVVAVFIYARITENSSGDGSTYSDSPRHYQLASFGEHNIRDVSYPDLTFAAEKAVHCVVHVRVKAMVERYGSLWDYYFGRAPQQIPTEGFGSGVITSADGYIITNYHVISGSEEIEVVLNDNRAFAAKIIGTDPLTDLALLKIEENDLPFLTFGDSEATRVGEWVLAVGNPFNLTSTVTAGIVSAKGRNLGIIGGSQQPRYRSQQQQQQQPQTSIESFIQTDAAVNRGNSGGALVNIRGEVIGINSAIYSQVGEFSGNAFAIPTTIVQKVVADLKEFGVVQRALLGVDMIAVDDKLAKEKDIKIEGVYVESLTENGGAAAAGIKEGDLIISINDVNVNSLAEVQEQVSKYRPNDNVNVTVVRDKKTQNFTVTLRNKDGNTQIVRGENADAILGATFEPISQRQKQELRIRSGVKVKDVGQGELKRLEIPNGFIITAINDRPVNSAKDIQNIVNTVEKGGRILINGVNERGQVVIYYMRKE